MVHVVKFSMVIPTTNCAPYCLIQCVYSSKETCELMHCLEELTTDRQHLATDKQPQVLDKVFPITSHRQPLVLDTVFPITYDKKPLVPLSLLHNFRQTTTGISKNMSNDFTQTDTCTRYSLLKRLF